LQHFLHKPVGFDTSSFALANTAIVVSSNIGETIAQHYSIECFRINRRKTIVFISLVFGRILGIWGYPTAFDDETKTHNLSLSDIIGFSFLSRY
jgi:hypothetical protein